MRFDEINESAFFEDTSTESSLINPTNKLDKILRRSRLTQLGLPLLTFSGAVFYELGMKDPGISLPLFVGIATVGAAWQRNKTTVKMKNVTIDYANNNGVHTYAYVPKPGRRSLSAVSALLAGNGGAVLATSLDLTNSEIGSVFERSVVGGSGLALASVAVATSIFNGAILTEEHSAYGSHLAAMNNSAEMKCI